MNVMEKIEKSTLKKALGETQYIRFTYDSFSNTNFQIDLCKMQSK